MLERNAPADERQCRAAFTRASSVGVTGRVAVARTSTHLRTDPGLDGYGMPLALDHATVVLQPDSVGVAVQR